MSSIASSKPVRLSRSITHPMRAASSLNKWRSDASGSIILIVIPSCVVVSISITCCIVIVSLTKLHPPMNGADPPRTLRAGLCRGRGSVRGTSRPRTEPASKQAPRRISLPLPPSKRKHSHTWRIPHGAYSPRRNIEAERLPQRENRCLPKRRRGFGFHFIGTTETKPQ